MSEKIEVVYKEVILVINGVEVHTGVYHKYLIYTDGDGNQEYARGGPQSREEGRYPTENPLLPWGHIITESGAYAPGTPDYIAPEEDERPRETIAEDDDLSAEWDAVKAAMDDIEAENHPYHSGGYHGQNSNTAVDTALERAGLPQPTQDDRDDAAPSPGSGYQLPESPQTDPADIRGIADYLEDIITKFAAAALEPSPLVFDLSHSGTIDLISLANSEAYFDLTGNGFATHNGWVDSADGLLVFDKNENGKIDNGTELFGTASGAANGFADLAAYDSNSDGKITSEDAIWESLQMWQDANEDGFSESTELHSLSYYNIISVSLVATSVSTTNEGNNIYYTGSFTVTGNTSYGISDVWFTQDVVNSVYVADDYSVQEGVLYMPFVSGHGTLPDLDIAMSIDDTGTDNLLGQVVDLFTMSLDELISGESATVDAVREIMFRWAGVDGVSPTDRGTKVDAQELGFLEKMMGQGFVQVGVYTNPDTHAGYDLTEAFSIAFNNVFAKLLIQSAGGELFEGDWHYDIATDSIVGVTGLDSAVLADLATLSSSATDKGEFWGNVVRMVEYAVGVDNLPGGDQTALDSAISTSDISLDLDIVLDSLVWHEVAGTTYTGTSGNDSQTGGTGNDIFNAGAGVDTIHGGIGHDTVNAGDGADLIYGETGDDRLNGGAGNDKYYYDLGHGYDIVEEVGNGDTNDRIMLGAGIDAGDITLTRVNNTDLLIHIDTGSATGDIFVVNQFNISAIGGSVETIEFSDTSTLNLLTQNYTLTGTAGNDYLVGVVSGGGGVDTIYGGAGNDTILGYAPGQNDYSVSTLYGEGGDDAISSGYGNDVIDGGNGNDTINAGDGDDTVTGGTGDDIIGSSGGTAGNDTYIYTSGKDTITDGSGTDVINLPSGLITAAYYRIGNDLRVEFDVNNSITIKNQYASYAVETLHFYSGTNVNLTTVGTITQGTESNDSPLAGTSGADVLYGFGGNDYIVSYAGNDTIYGGSGNDSIDAGNDNDTIYGGAGDDNITGTSGSDVFVYESGNDTLGYDGSATITLGGGWTREDISFTRNGNGNDLKIYINASNSMTLTSQFFYGASYSTILFSDTTTLTIASQDVTSYGTASGDSIYGVSTGSSLNDIIYGYGGNDGLYGGNGNDTIYGGDANDTITGGSGNDILDGGAGNDSLEGDGGNDTYVYTAGLDTIVWEDSGTDTLLIKGYTVNDLTFSNYSTYGTKITINSGTDEIIVSDLRYPSSTWWVDNISFEDGFTTTLPNYASWTNGTSGADTQTGTSGADTIIGFAGNDTIDGAGGNDAIHGGSGNDTVKGGAGTDLVHGGVGDDFIWGGDGLDTLFGGIGADTFVFEAANAYNNVDVIKDFHVGESDALDLSDLLGAYNPISDAIADFIQITESAGNSALFVDRDGLGSTYGFDQVASLIGATGLTDEAALLAAGTLIAA